MPQNRSYNPNDFVFDDEEPGTASNLVSGVKNLAASAISGPLSLLELPVRAGALLTGQDQPTNLPSESVRKSLGGTEPDNVFSRALNYTVGNWPLLLFGGPVTAGKIGADLAGSLGVSAAQEAGLGAVGQIAGGLLGAKGFKAASNAISKAPKNPEKYKEFIESWYNKEKSIGSKIPVKSANLDKKLNEIYSRVNKEYVNPGKFDEAARNRVITNLKNAEKSIVNPNLTASDLFNEKKMLNNAYGWKNSTENKYYHEIRKVFKDELSTIAEEHPEYGKVYKTADELYSLKNWQGPFKDFLEKHSKDGVLEKLLPNPLAHAAIGILGGLYKGTPKGLLVGAGSAAIAGTGHIANNLIKETKFLKKVFNTEGGKKLLLEIMADSARQNSVKLASNLRKLNSLADKYEKEPENRSYNPDDFVFAG